MIELLLAQIGFVLGSVLKKVAYVSLVLCRSVNFQRKFRRRHIE